MRTISQTERVAKAATNAFLARQSEAVELARAILERAEDHFGEHPDYITWGHVGDAGYTVERLREVAVRIGAVEG